MYHFVSVTRSLEALMRDFLHYGDFLGRRYVEDQSTLGREIKLR